MRIWMRRSSHGVGTLQVMAITGAPSSQAAPTPVARLVAPGPRVETQTPGVPVRAPMVDAMKPADVSFAVSTYSIELPRSASISGRTGPLGIPKAYLTPACSSMRTMSSAFFIDLVVYEKSPRTLPTFSRPRKRDTFVLNAMRSSANRAQSPLPRAGEGWVRVRGANVLSAFPSSPAINPVFLKHLTLELAPIA